ncbi:MAG: DUF4290 domain-containing protein [Bacteroidales bacterium]|nr:DUF4290 domain-containing protein [Bacteroidales bacterium]
MENKDYNTTRPKLLMPEYGRHVQDMIEYVVNIPDKAKRNEQIQAVVSVMGTLNPQLRDVVDFRHKLWDHVQIISDFKIDIDSPYPLPSRESVSIKPDPIPLKEDKIRATCYGRNIQNMIDLIAERPDDELKKHMIKVIAYYMKQQYLIWNKDSVAEETIFEDIKNLSGGRLIVPPDVHIGSGMADASTRKPHIPGNPQQPRPQHNGKKQQKKKWKKN